MTKPLARRSFLKGAGVAIALPLFESMTTRQQLAAAAKKPAVPKAKPATAKPKKAPAKPKKATDASSMPSPTPAKTPEHQPINDNELVTYLLPD